jgi:hypothetical protein
VRSFGTALQPLVATLLHVAMVSGISTAREWQVALDGSGDTNSIQAAIDSARAGDKVNVAAGTYNESLDFVGKDIVVHGQGASTIIDATGLDGPCVRFLSGESNQAILEYFTITGGTGKWYGTAQMGGAIIVWDSGPTLRQLSIVRNRVSAPGSQGGGIRIYGTSFMHPANPRMVKCEIAFNEAYVNGGGIGFSGFAAPVVVECQIHDNLAFVGDGGGIWGNTGASGVVIQSTDILSNTAGDHGGGIHVTGVPNTTGLTARIEYNLIAHNVASGNDSQDLTGGGIYLSYVDGYVLNNTIVYNSASGGSGTVAGGIAMRGGGSYIIERNIIAYTVMGDALICDEGASVTIDNNLSWQNWGIGRFACADWVTVNDNLEEDPLFCQPEFNNFSVQELSPALKSFASPIGYLVTAGCSGNKLYTTWSGIKALIWR